MESLPKPPGERVLRKGRVSMPGQIYLVTTVTHGRARIFDRFAAARTLIQQLHDMDASGCTRTIAFVVMPDHLHWLMQLSGGASLSEVVRHTKGASSRKLGIQLGGGRVWQQGFHDHAVRRDEDLKNLARYVIYNPVRAGLVSRPHDYPHWDATWL